MLCWLADWALLPPLLLSAFCALLGPEPQKRVVVEALEPCPKNCYSNYTHLEEKALKVN